MHHWRRVNWFKLTTKGRRRQKITKKELVKTDMSIKEVTYCMTSNGTKWQKIMHIVNPD